MSVPLLLLVLESNLFSLNELLHFLVLFPILQLLDALLESLCCSHDHTSFLYLHGRNRSPIKGALICLSHRMLTVFFQEREKPIAVENALSASLTLWTPDNWRASLFLVFDELS